MNVPKDRHGTNKQRQAKNKSKVQFNDLYSRVQTSHASQSSKPKRSSEHAHYGMCLRFAAPKNMVCNPKIGFFLAQILCRNSTLSYDMLKPGYAILIQVAHILIGFFKFEGGKWRGCYVDSLLRWARSQILFVNPGMLLKEKWKCITTAYIVERSELWKLVVFAVV